MIGTIIRVVIIAIAVIVGVIIFGGLILCKVGSMESSNSLAQSALDNMGYFVLSTPLYAAFLLLVGIWLESPRPKK